MSFLGGQQTGFPSASSAAQSFGGFGTATSTTANKGFGQPAMGFGSTPSSTGGFGANVATNAFGATQQSNAFGTGQTTSAFGAPQQAGAFGNTQAPGLFGAQPSTSFGAPTANTFGTSGGTTTFGSAPVSTSSFSFGSNLGTATSAGGTSLFGGAPTSGTTMFGQAQTGSTPFQGFGNFGGTQTSTGGGLFGGTNTSLQTSMGNTGFNFTGLGTKPTLGQQSTFPSTFGAGTLGTPSLFGQNQQTGMFGLNQQQQQQQNPMQSQDELVYNAVLAVNLFGDERDAVLARCNLLQAQWGTGKGYYAQGAPPVSFTPNNPFFRFKALGYSQLPSGREEDGVVSIYFNKKESEIKAQQQQVVSSISSTIFKGSAQFTLIAQGVRESSENGCQMLVTVSERTTSGQTRKIPASELANNLVSMRAQLANFGIENIVPVVKPSPEWIREYLATPPSGIDPRLWQQAQLDSPDRDRFIPVPMVGFAELRWRMKCQEAESSRHMAYLAQAEQQVSELRRAVTETEVKIKQRRQALLGLQRRLLHLLVKLQVARRAGTAMLPLEEDLRTRLEQIQAQLSRPSHCKARLGELLAQMRLQTLTTGQLGGSLGQNYTFDSDSVRELHKFLTMEQEGISHLIDVATSDRDSLKVISQGMVQIKRTIEANQSFILTSLPEPTLH